MDTSFTLSDIINIGLLFTTLITVFIAASQLRSSANTQRAMFLKDLYTKLRTDKEAIQAYYMLEYDQFEYNIGFHGSDLEPRIDRLLTLLDIVCEMHERKAILDKEMHCFDYQIKRVVYNKGIQNYLDFLTQFYAANKIQHQPFFALQEYARRL